MHKLSHAHLLSLEAYAKARPEMRAQVIAHKKNRSLALGEHVTLIFEDEITIRYQIQEMLRAERIYEEVGIQDELDAYNPLIPDGSNWKATLLLEYPDVVQRQAMLVRLKGIEDHLWVQVAERPKIYAFADEDMERANAEKTSAVHFMRIEFDSASLSAIKAGAAISIGIDHPHYQVQLSTLPENIRNALVKDLS